MPVSPLQFQAQIALNLTNIQEGIAITEAVLKKYSNLDQDSREPELERIINHSDYLQRRYKLYQVINNSARFDLCVQLAPLLEEYEGKIQQLYFHKQLPSYASKAVLQEECRLCKVNYEKEYITAQIEIHKYEIIVQHLDLVLLQSQITDLLQITNLTNELELQIKTQQHAYHAYIQKLNEVARWQRLLSLETKASNTKVFNPILVQYKGKIFGLQLEEHYAWCLLQNAVTTKKMAPELTANFKLIIQEYSKFYKEQYSDIRKIQTDFVVELKLLEAIMSLDVNLGEFGFPHADVITELYAHSIVANEQPTVIGAGNNIEPADALAYEILDENQDNPIIRTALKPRDKLII